MFYRIKQFFCAHRALDVDLILFAKYEKGTGMVTKICMKCQKHLHIIWKKDDQLFTYIETTKKPPEWAKD